MLRSHSGWFTSRQRDPVVGRRGSAEGVRRGIRFPQRFGADFAICVLVGFVLVVADVVHAQPAERGTLTGRVLERETGEPLPGASVVVDTLQIGAATNVDGRYRIPAIPPGTYDIRISFTGFAPKTVAGVEIRAGETTTLDVTLDPAVAELGEVVVTAEEERGSTADVLNERKTAAAVVDVLDVEQIQVAGGDAAAAIEQVSGAEVSDGKFVKVRGFGGRYGKVTINGVPIPSIAPDENAVPLDIISSDVLQSATVTKGWTPDQPADFTGGLVDLRTIETPAERQLSFSSETSYNTVSSLTDGLTIGGCNDTWTGFSDCYAWPESVRSLPDTVGITGEVLFTGGPLSVGDTASVFRRAGDVLESMPVNPSVRTIPFGQSYDLSGGTRVSLGGRPLGLQAVGSYANDFQQFGDYEFNAPDLDPRFSEVNQTEQTVQVGGLVGLSVEPADAQRISTTLIFNRQTNDLARAQTGLFDPSGEQLTARTVTNQRIVTRLFSGQLAGDHTVFGRATAEWTAAYTRGSLLEPATMPITYQGPQGAETIADSLVVTGLTIGKSQESQRRHFDQQDDAFLGKFDFTVPFRVRGRRVSVKTGAFANIQNRTLDGHRVNFVIDGRFPQDEFGFLVPDLVFVPDRVVGCFDGVNEQRRDSACDPGVAGPKRPGILVGENTQATDNADAALDVVAGYLMVDVEPLDGLRITGGVRIASTDQVVDVIPKHDSFIDRREDIRTEQSFQDVLPGVTAQVALTETMDIRASFGRTLARPQLREIVPAVFQSRPGAQAIAGNPNLERTLIDNYDLRYSWYPTPTSLFSVSGFFKFFESPIEAIGGTNGRLINGGEAVTYGVEGELRLPLGLLSPSLSALAIRSNATVLRTESSGFTFIELRPGGDPTVVSIPSESRALFGQTPFLLNTGLTVEPAGWGTSLTALYRYTGEQLRFLTGNLRTFREPLTTLDVVVRQDLFRGLRLNVEVRNLIGNEIRFASEQATIEPRQVEGSRVVRTVETIDLATQEAYDRGRSIEVGLSWSLN